MNDRIIVRCVSLRIPTHLRVCYKCFGTARALPCQRVTDATRWYVTDRLPSVAPCNERSQRKRRNRISRISGKAPMKTLSPLAPAFAALGLLAAVTPASAQLYPPPQNVVGLQASASTEVTKDLLTVVFSTSREAPDAATVQTQLKLALDAALAEARKVARPKQLEVNTGNFSLYPRHTARGLSGWQGSTELVVEGLDAQAIAQLTGRINTMTIARVGFSLSREARQKAERDLTAQAVASFRDKAQAVSREFGFGGYSIREVQVQSAEPSGGPMPMFRAQAAGMPAAAEALPVEAGKASVTVTVGGSIQMSPK